MCFSKRVRASDAFILSLSSFRDTLHAALALSASSSNLRLLGQGILASTEDCIPASNSTFQPARKSYPAIASQRWSAGRVGVGSTSVVPFCGLVDCGTNSLTTVSHGYCATLPPSEDHGMANLSGKSRAKIAAAQRARWAKVRAKRRS